MSAIYGYFYIDFKKEDDTPDGEMAMKVCESLLEQYSGWIEDYEFGLDYSMEEGRLWVASDGFDIKNLVGDYNSIEFQKMIFKTFKPAQMKSVVTSDHEEIDDRIDYWRMSGSQASGEIRIDDYYELRNSGDGGFYGSDSGSDEVILFNDSMEEITVHVHCKHPDGEECEDDCYVHTSIEDGEPAADLWISTDVGDFYLLNADGEHITNFEDFDRIDYEDCEEIK